MHSKSQLKILVILCLIVIACAWFYINRSSPLISGFRLGSEFEDFKDIIKSGVKELSDSTAIKNISSSFSSIKQQIQDREQDQEIITKEIVGKILSKLPKKRDTVIYNYEPWGIEFSYDILMVKEVDEVENDILLYYEDLPDIKVLISNQKLKEQTFNDWLNNHYDLQKLNKKGYNDLIFWMQDISSDDFKEEEYYLNIDDSVYTFSLSCPVEEVDNYWISLDFIVKSFKTY